MKHDPFAAFLNRGLGFGRRLMLGLVLVHFFRFPAVQFVRVGEDPGFGSSVQAVDGKAEFLLPAMTGHHGAVEEGGDLFPRIQEFSFVHSFPRPSFSFRSFVP